MYCGVFTPCKNCNIETRSRRAEPRSAMPWRVAPRLARCQATAINTWMTQEWGRVTWPPRVPQWRNNRRALFSLVSDEEFIRETEARLQVVLGGRSLLRFVVEEDFVWSSVNWVRENNNGSEASAVQASPRRELWRMLPWREDLGVIFGVWYCGSFCVENRC
jgi:hypothetical protein